MPQTVALIGGTGRLGPGLALRLSRGGLPVTIGSRELQHALDVAERVTALGGVARIRGATNADAAAGADLAILTVPYEAQAGLLPDLAGALAGKVVVSTTVPVRFDPALGPVAVRVAEGSAAEQVAALLPTSQIVAGFHTVSSVHLSRLDRDLDEDVLLCGDDEGAKADVRQIAGVIPGVRVVDAGRLGNAQHLEQLTVLLLSINRLSHRSVGVRLTGLDLRGWAATRTGCGRPAQPARCRREGRRSLLRLAPCPSSPSRRRGEAGARAHRPPSRRPSPCISRSAGVTRARS